MQTILGGRGTGAASLVFAGSKGSPTGGCFNQRATRSRASAPPAITESTLSNPAPPIPISSPPKSTPGSVRPAFCSVTKRMWISPRGTHATIGTIVARRAHESVVDVGRHAGHPASVDFLHHGILASL